MNHPTWDDIAAELAIDIQQLRDGDIIILEAGPRYVQLFHGPDGGSLEASSNHSLPAAAHLSTGSERRLAALGWRPPHPPGRLNWWVDYNALVPSIEVAWLANTMIDTLRRVMDVADAAQVTKKSFNAYGA